MRVGAELIPARRGAASSCGRGLMQMRMSALWPAAQNRTTILNASNLRRYSRPSARAIHRRYVAYGIAPIVGTSLPTIITDGTPVTPAASAS